MAAVVIRLGHVMRLLLLMMMKTMQGSKRERERHQTIPRKYGLT